MRTRLSSLFALLVILCLAPLSVQAQDSLEALLSAPDLDAFPHVSVYLDVRDAGGQFIHGLQGEQIQILENDGPLPAGSIQELMPGAQVVVAINPGPALGVRNSKGFSRYDYIKTALADWARARQGSTLDDWSLVITDGPEINHVSDSMQWLEALEEDQTNAREATPNLDTLFRAVDLAADTPSRPGMGRAVLFISPPMEGEQNQPLDNLIAQARQQSVKIFVWAISSAGEFPTAGMNNLTNLADQTGGQMLLYSGEEELPDPEAYVSPLRWIYLVNYRSGITTSGQHKLVIQINTGELAAETPVQAFEIDLQPPKPTFVAPPLQIERKLPTVTVEGDTENHNTVSPEQENVEPTSGGEGGPGGPDGQEAPGGQRTPDQRPELVPTQYTVQVVFDFPDERIRPVTQAALYVDGVLEDENLEPPFDQFTWKLDSYLSSGTHTLQVQATDSLGLVGTSIDLPVAIVVENTAANPWLTIQRNLPILTILLVVVAGAILLLVLLLGGQLRPASLRAAHNGSGRRQKLDPLTQPVVIAGGNFAEDVSGKGQNWAGRLQWPQRHISPKAHAYLSRISSGDSAEKDTLSTTPPVPITADEITLGSNPNLATMVLEDPSVEGLHARLMRQEDGTFRISDEGSVAGTWVNYSPVSHEGTKLIHGDMIHIGRIGFRFTLRQPTQVRKPVITDGTEHRDGEEQYNTPQSRDRKPESNRKPEP